VTEIRYSPGDVSKIFLICLHYPLARDPSLTVTKSDLIDLLAADQSTFCERDVELAVKAMLQQMSDALAFGERIEIRGFGAFSLHYRPPRIGRNPKTGESVALPGRHIPRFKPGKELRERVNAAADMA
jgi:integration host factor subunit beta